MSKVMKQAPDVDMVMLRRHFVVVKPAQWVVVALGKSLNSTASARTVPTAGSTSRYEKACPASSKPATSQTTDSKLTMPSLVSPLYLEPRRCGSTTPSPSFSPLLLTTLASSTSENRTPTTSSKTYRNSTPSPSTGLVPYSADSPLTGNIPHAPVTYQCHSIYKQPC